MLTSAVMQQFLTSWKRRESNTLSRCWPRLWFNNFWQAEKEDNQTRYQDNDLGCDATNFWQTEKEDNQTRYQDVDLGCDSTIFDKLKKKRIKHAMKMLTSAVIQQFLTSWKEENQIHYQDDDLGCDSTNFWQAEKEDNQTRYQDVDLGCDSTIFDKLKKKRIKHAIKMLTSTVIQ